MSEEQIRRVLSLDKKFEEAPVLREMLVNGEVSPNKLARVAPIANEENQEELAQKVQLLSNRAVETFVRDQKFVHVHKSLFQNNPEISLELSNEVRERLIKLQEKGIDINDLLTELLDLREEAIQEMKEGIGGGKQTDSRYIPVKTRMILNLEHGDICSIEHCKKKADHIHHSQPFSMGKTHDPRFLAPLCKEHHEIAHAINLRVQEKRKQAKVM